jgi:hypothetical protein
MRKVLVSRSAAGPVVGDDERDDCKRQTGAESDKDSECGSGGRVAVAPFMIRPIPGTEEANYQSDLEHTQEK